ncbi:MAG: LysM peptidoglycan-binding domain-containing protein [Neisseria sp.]|nr:LysM peptidoglycan-binding domain-containing protein [Neisseria sp.]
MRKTIITLLCTLGLAISAPSFALNVKADAPQRYTIKKGDTLWGISGMYLRSPWKWPELWGMNKAQIKNPHRIYPGQVLVLHYVNGQPRLSVEGGSAGGIPTIKLSPGVYDTTDGYSIPTLPLSILRNFMDYPQIIDKEETAKAPVLIAGPDKRILYSPGDRVYADNIEKQGRYLTYRVNQDIIDPDTRQFLGQEVVYSGEVATLTSRSGGPKVKQNADEAEKLNPDERYTELHPLVKVPTTVAAPLTVLKATSEMKEGDYLRFVEEGSSDRFNFVPHEPFAQIQAKVVRVFNGVSEAGQYQTILLNKGELDGVDRGTVLNLYKIRDRSRISTKKRANSDNHAVFTYAAIPAEEFGTAMVYSSSDHLSYAIIINVRNEVTLGDIASNPGYDLEDFPIVREHDNKKK